MSCPVCGATEECRCATREFQPRHVRVPRFQPDEPARRIAHDFHAGTQVESESSDVSEQQFAASLDATSSPRPRARFIPDSGMSSSAASVQTLNDVATEAVDTVENQATGLESAAEEEIECVAPMEAQAVAEQEHSGWRDEVAERVHNYRVRRRRRAPRYPS